MDNRTTPAPVIDAAPTGLLGIGAPSAPELWEIRWRNGTTTGPFLSADEAIDAALDVNQRFDISPDMEIRSPECEGEIREVGDR